MFSKTFGCTRMIYNYYLDKRIKLYEEEKITFGYTKCANDLTILKKEKDFLKEVDSISLQQALRHLDTAFLKYKLEELGKRLVKTDKFFASSQLCNVCGFQNPDTKNLSVREWICPCCQTHHDRDINAAINIQNEGMRIALA